VLKSASDDAETKVQERFSELLKSTGLQRDRAIAENELLLEQVCVCERERILLL